MVKWPQNSFFKFPQKIPFFPKKLFNIKIFAKCFKKPWIGLKSVNFDFSAKSSSIDYNESNKPTPKSLAHIGSNRSLVELWVPKSELFTFSHFLLNWKVYFSPWAVGGIKSTSTDYNESNKPNSKSLAHIGSEKSLVVPKNKLFHFFHIFHSTENFTCSP